ncbi:ComEC/Rec2 family competence protein [Niastella caeni]|uniref:ComEC/Rec2 family competence protein n=1 Tax=Niastella caeni TaxID=2569763 RepID=A0A4V4H0N5_9BACT|nr:ComEC/Rec2 family competence protein [Niastella caeni]THU37186.1 ComEC/Rec2 family competence protein [Niastella caeni]
MSLLPAWPIWKEAPFIRLIIPLIAGISCQWYWPFSIFVLWLLFAFSALALWLFSTQPLSRQYRVQWVNGAWLHALLFATGSLLFYYKDIRHQQTSITRQYTAGNAVLVTIEEPLSEKKQSFKTIASVQAVLFNHAINKASGKILLYFQKDSNVQHLQYGNQLLLFKVLQPIKNTGNPGCFDYQRFCTFRGISYQVYLRKGEFVALKIENENLFRKYLLSTREKIVNILKKYIPGSKEAGLAEAMLIGYKDDLDKNLVQLYSNTGVVHIIAISGLHLGLIYWLLILLCKPLSKYKTGRIVQPILIIAGLWLFSCIAGASPSVLRSAVMFTCIVIGASINRKTSVYNSLAASAFILLCFNPTWLWDAGFQLSYAAVLSLAIFYNPIYNLLFFQNKLPDLIWKSICVTLAAQILTVPVSVYLFHQFPNLFLVANLLAVPISGIIIIGEILLCLTGIFPLIATGIGYLLRLIIYWLNTYIEQVGSLPFATTNDLLISLPQLICLYAFIGAMAWWLLDNKKKGVRIALMALLFFMTFRLVDVWSARQQKKLIVYNIPKHSAIDVMIGTNFFCKTDSALQQNDLLQKFHMQPSRLLHRVNNLYTPAYSLVKKNFFRLGNTSFLLIDQPLNFKQAVPGMNVDITIILNNPAIKISQITDVFTCRQFVFDASNPAWKVAKWQQECDQLGLQAFSVADKGAFVFNLY